MKHKIRYSIGLFILYYVIFVNLIPYFTKFDNYVPFDEQYSDFVDYQVLAVNFAKGHGIQRTGIVGDYKSYKFSGADPTKYKYYKPNFLDNSGSFYTFRVPGYSLFLGIIYKMFGINPIVVKHIQLMLLVFVAVCLPYVGFYYWGKSGFLSGIVGSFFSIAFSFRLANVLLMDAILPFLLMLIVLAWIYMERKPSTASRAMLGLTFGLGLLMKGTFILIPVFTALYFFYQFIVYRDKKILLHLFTIAFFSFLTVLPWSIYASVQAGSFIFLDKQGNNFAVVLAGHNEYVVRTGVRNSFWVTDGTIFHYNYYLNEKSNWMKVFHYYRYHPDYLFITLGKQFIEGFACFLFFNLILLLYFCDLLKVFFVRNFPKKTNQYLLLVLPLLLVGLGFSYLVSVNSALFYTLFSDYLSFKIILFTFALLFIALIIKYYSFASLKIPWLFLIIFVNFFAINVLFSPEHSTYQSRHVKVSEFLYILFGCQFLFQYLKNLYDDAYYDVKAHTTII